MRRSAIVFLALVLFTGIGIVPAGTLAQFRSTLGDIEVELYDQDKPVTVQNFIHYVQSGAYENEFAHRLVPGFVLQGGGYTITNRGTTNWSVVAITNFPPITNEFAVGRRFSNTYGTIAMAKLAGDTNSATSQWYFNLTNNASLDKANSNNLFVVFGHVIKGTNVLNTFSRFKNFTGTQKSNLVYRALLPPFDTLPLLRPYVWDTNLVFIDISLLQIAVTNLPGGARQIAWNGPAGMTNIVEFTTNFPPIWNTLTRTNGTGARISFTDNDATTDRFYRVRIAF